MELFEKLGIDWRLLIAQLVNFAILMSALVYLLYKPILSVLEKRRLKISESLENAEKIADELKQTTIQTEKLLSEARAEAQKVLTEATKQAELVRNNAVTQARVEVGEIIASGKMQLTADRDAMVSEVRLAAANLVAMATEKIIGEKLTSAKDKVLIEKTLNSK